MIKNFKEFIKSTLKSKTHKLKMLFSFKLLVFVEKENSTLLKEHLMYLDTRNNEILSKIVLRTIYGMFSLSKSTFLKTVTRVLHYLICS